MQTCIRLLVLALVLSCPLLVQATTPNGHRPSENVAGLTPRAPGVVYVKLRAGSSAFSVAQGKGAKVQSTGGTQFQHALRTLKMRTVVPFDADAPKDDITRNLGIDRMYCIYYDNKMIEPLTAVQLLLATGEVECGAPRYLFPISKTPNDPQISSQWALTNMNVFSAWDVTTGNSSVVLADVDDGFNIVHEDLKNAIVAGWDLVGAVSTASGAAFQPDSIPMPDNTNNSHGTHTAGCMAASGDNAKGIAGVAYGCRILAIKAAGSDDDNVGGISAGPEGIHYAATHGAKVVNCSWGGPISGSSLDFENTILEEAIQRNILVVAAAGNAAPTIIDLGKTTQYPACGPGVLAVGSTDQSDAASNFSDYGHPVSVWAPGRGILSCNYPGTNGYNAEDGTSFASPLTAGVAGLLVTIHPTWTSRFIARQIIQTCDNVVNPADQYNYWGRVNAGVAMTSPSGPGLTIVSYSLDGVNSDSLGAVGNASDLKVTFKNVVATGSGITATLLTRTGYTAGSNATATLGSVLVDATVQGDFQITRTGTYSEGMLPVRFHLSDGANYDDTLDLLIPLKRLPGFVLERAAPLGQSIKRISNTAAWAAFGFEQTNFQTVAQFAVEGNGVWSDTMALSDGTTAAYDVESLDTLTAWFGTGANSQATIISTTDAGKTWNSADLTGFTPFVNSIHFFDAKNGICIGDPNTSTTVKEPWGIGISADGGQTWDQIPNPPLNGTAGEASWNNAATWVGDNGWFGSNSSHIWHTTNKGQTWAMAKTTGYPNSLGIGFDDDATHGIAIFRKITNSAGALTGVKGMMLSTDAGATWKVIKLPLAGMNPSAVRFVPGTNTAVLTSDSGIFRSPDFGATWTNIGIPVSFSPSDGDLSVFSGGGKTTVSFISNSNGIGTYVESTSTFSANPISLNFGTVIVGTPATLPTTITNGGSSSITINKIEVKSSAPTDFTSDSGLVTFPKVLAPGATLTVNVTFNPATAGAQSATLLVTLSDGTTTQVALSGVGKTQSGVADVGASGSFSLAVSMNPFQTVTQLQYELPRTESIRLSVFDAVGREVAVLANGTMAEGTHSASFDGRNLAAGAYYCTLVTESGARLSRAVTLLR